MQFNSHDFPPDDLPQGQDFSDLLFDLTASAPEGSSNVSVVLGSSRSFLTLSLLVISTTEVSWRPSTESETSGKNFSDWLVPGDDCGLWDLEAGGVLLGLARGL